MATQNIQLKDGIGNLLMPKTNAATVTYDNSSSGLAAQNVQDAINEVKETYGGDISYMPGIGHDFPNINTTTNELEVNIGNIIINGKRYLLPAQTCALFDGTNTTSGWKILLDLDTMTLSYDTVLAVVVGKKIVLGQIIASGDTTNHIFLGAQFSFPFTVDGRRIETYNFTNFYNYMEHINMHNLVNAGPDSSVYRLGMWLKITPNTKIAIHAMNKMYALIAIGDEGMPFNWSNSLKFNTGWINKQSGFANLYADNTNIGGKYALIFFRHYSNTTYMTKELIKQNYRVYISDWEDVDYTKTLSSSVGAVAVAHRGIHVNDIPEESLDAWRTAALLGMDMAEADVCITKDRKFVMSHDIALTPALIEKTNGSALTSNINIVTLNFSQIRSDYRLKSANKKYKKQIPSLEEYLTLCRDEKIYALLEIKSTGAGVFTNSEAEEVYNLCRDIVGKGKFCVCSSHIALLDYIRSLDDEVNLMYMNVDVRGTTNTITGESRFTQYTHTLLSGSAITGEIVKAYNAIGAMAFDGDLVTPATLPTVVSTLNYPPVITNTCGANLRGKNGARTCSDDSWDDFDTNGTITNNQLVLTNGQYVAFSTDMRVLGSMNLKLIFSGSLTVKSQNLSETYTSSSNNPLDFRNLIYNAPAGFIAIATANTTINRIDFQYADI